MPRTILLADDSITIRKVVELTFGDTDIRVESVGSGREALERLRELKPDLVLADVVMPGPSGYEICRAVKKSVRPVPVLLLAGTFEPFDADQARDCGSDGYVTKPFDARSLVERVEALLARGRAASPPAAQPASPPAPRPASRRTPARAPEPARDDEVEAMMDDVAEPAAPAGPVAVAEPKALETPPAAAPSAASLSPADIDAIAEAVVARLSDKVLREIAWDVVPDLAEIIVRERIRELEREDRGSS